MGISLLDAVAFLHAHFEDTFFTAARERKTL